MGVLQTCVFVAVCFLQVIPSCNRNVPITGITHEDQMEKDGSHFNPRSKREACSVSPYYDVECHDRCPRPNEQDWKDLVQYFDGNCSKRFEGSKFHCAKNPSGHYVTACAYPVSCNIGKEPIIKYAEGHAELAEISCHWCPSNRFNPEEGKLSNTYSYCLKTRRECPSSEGQVECDMVTGVARLWTDSKCRCNIRKNYMPLSKKVNNCTDDYTLYCLEHRPCPDTADGRKQEYLSSNYSCAPVCGDGFHPRTLDTDDCIPIENNVTAVYENATFTTTTTVVSSTSTTTTTTTPPTPSTPSTRPTSENGNGSSTSGKIAIGAAVIGCVAVISVVAIACWCRNHRKSERSRNTRNPRGDTESSENIPLTVQQNTSPENITNADTHSQQQGVQNQQGGKYLFEELPFEVRCRPLCDPQIVHLADQFGDNWEHVMIKMGLKMAQIQQIKLDKQGNTAGSVFVALKAVRSLNVSNNTLTLDMIFKASQGITQAHIELEEIIKLAKDEETFWNVTSEQPSEDLTQHTHSGTE